jgi:hypothetical protein
MSHGILHFARFRNAMTSNAKRHALIVHYKNTATSLHATLEAHGNFFDDSDFCSRHDAPTGRCVSTTASLSQLVCELPLLLTINIRDLDGPIQNALGLPSSLFTPPSLRVPLFRKIRLTLSPQTTHCLFWAYHMFPSHSRLLFSSCFDSGSHQEPSPSAKCGTLDQCRDLYGFVDGLTDLAPSAVQSMRELVSHCVDVSACQ